MTSPLRVLIAGGTGMIGTPLTSLLRAQGHTVSLLSRSSTSSDSYRWNPGVEQLDLDALPPIDVIINLAGASISKMPWTAKRKNAILRSRVEATETIVDALRRASHRPTRLLNASAVGFYGDRGDETLNEMSVAGTGFLAEVCVRWEEAALQAPPGVGVVLLRTGLVLGQGGALSPLRLLTKLCVSGPLAGGKAWWPWISLADEVAAIAHLVNSQLTGPVNLVGPTPATSGTLMRALARLMHRPYWLPAPRFAISLGLGEAGRELLLSSQRVLPRALTTDGFTFSSVRPQQALTAALSEK